MISPVNCDQYLLPSDDLFLEVYCMISSPYCRCKETLHSTSFGKCSHGCLFYTLKQIIFLCNTCVFYFFYFVFITPDRWSLIKLINLIDPQVHMSCVLLFGNTTTTKKKGQRRLQKTNRLKTFGLTKNCHSISTSNSAWWLRHECIVKIAGAPARERQHIPMSISANITVSTWVTFFFSFFFYILCHLQAWLHYK